MADCAYLTPLASFSSGRLIGLGIRYSSGWTNGDGIDRIFGLASRAFVTMMSFILVSMVTAMCELLTFIQMGSGK